jgi:hypothetical protein
MRSWAGLFPRRFLKRRCRQVRLREGEKSFEVIFLGNGPA